MCEYPSLFHSSFLRRMPKSNPKEFSPLIHVLTLTSTSICTLTVDVDVDVDVDVVVDVDVDVDVDVLQVDFLTRPTSLLSTRLRCRVGFAACRKTIHHLKT